MGNLWEGTSTTLAKAFFTKQNKTKHAIPCYPMLSHTIPCYPVLSHAIPCYPMLSHTIPGYPMLSHAIPCYPMLSHAIPGYPMPSHAIPCHPMLSHAIPCSPLPLAPFGGCAGANCQALSSGEPQRTGHYGRDENWRVYGADSRATNLYQQLEGNKINGKGETHTYRPGDNPKYSNTCLEPAEQPGPRTVSAQGITQEAQTSTAKGERQEVRTGGNHRRSERQKGESKKQEW